MADSVKIAGSAYISKEGLYLYPNEDLTGEDVLTFINYNRGITTYGENYRYYTGEHKILKKKFDPKSFRPDNRVISNWANYVVDTYIGYFMGTPVKIQLEDDSKNELLQNWLKINTFQDKLSEVAKQVAIYGLSYMLAYQDEDSNTCVAVVPPDEGFIIYDTSIKRKPIAFVRYAYFNSELVGEVYTESKVYSIDKDGTLEETGAIVPFKEVPAVEFYANEERLSLVGKIRTLVDAYDKAFSQKANEIQYFDQAYLLLLGLNLPKDPETGKPILDFNGDKKAFYDPSPESANAKVEFLAKPDSDNMQENMLNRLVNDIFQTAMVANLNDEAFSGNSSGVAIRYKLLSMQNQAALEERKFTIALTNFLGNIVSLGKVIGSVTVDEVKAGLSFTFKRNIPVNDADEANTAKTLEGVVSKETQLKVLSVVDDPKAEIEKIDAEKENLIKQSLQNSINATDMFKGGVTDAEPEERSILESQRASREEVDNSKPEERQGV